MRAGGCSVSQALAPDAAGMVKQAIGLARRRGHAQVTPLHVANTMLSSSSGLLRSACLQSHSHPLQCKALELCFNVALNRLPSAASTSPLIPTHHPPSLSNALVAAFKRAQAHQRRGSNDSQQQPLLSVKIDLDQLVVSILDDPSVSRVMREAGFSSAQVKSNVEHAISSDPNPNPNYPSSASAPDITSLVEGLMGCRKRGIVVVGECMASAEAVVKGLMDRVDRGHVPEILQNLQIITLSLLSFAGMPRGEVEKKVAELRCLLAKSCCLGRAAVIYLDDVRWVAEYYYKANNGACEDRGGAGGYNYCPVEHVIMEIGRLVSSGNNNGGEDGGRRVVGGRFWLMGIATYQTYMKCKVGNPSLEIVWALQPLTVPVGSLALSLNGDHCGTRNICRSNSINGVWPMLEDTAENQVTCSINRPINVDKDIEGSTSSTLPSWLQHYKENNKKATRDEDCLGSLHRLHQNHRSEMQFQFSSTSPSSSPISSYNHQDLHQNHHPWSPWGQNHPRLSKSITGGFKANSGALPSTIMDNERFNEVNAENLKILCNSLERTVPWKKAIIPDIASTILQCRAGLMRKNKQDTWLFFQGGDLEAKEKISREIASIIFGVRSFYSVGELLLHSSSSSTKSDSSADDALRKKRLRAEGNHGLLDRLAEAVRENPHRVFLVEDIERVDLNFRMGVRGAMERGSFWGSGGEEIVIRDAIFILSCESFDSSSRVCSPPAKQRVERGEGRDKEENFHCLDLNVCAVDDDQTTDVWCGEEAEGLLDAVDRVFFFKLPEDL